MAAIFEARERLRTVGPGETDNAAATPAGTLAKLVERLHPLCERHRDDSNKALQAVAREFLNDWSVITPALADPKLPLTNNAAKRQLRHCVIARRTSAIHAARTGLPAPSLPPIPPHWVWNIATVAA